MSLDELLDKNIDELELPIRVFHMLEIMGVYKIRDVINLTGPQLLQRRNFGKKSLNELRLKLRQFGLVLSDENEMNISKFIENRHHLAAKLEECEKLVKELRTFVFSLMRRVDGN